MPMKISLALGPRRRPSRQTAWGCLTTNVALPGFGSLLAGRISGYPQAVLAVGGLILTIGFGARFIIWALTNWSRLYGAEEDPLESLGDIWLHARWAFLGIVLFGLGWLWALATSMAILNSARRSGQTEAPPRLH
jgi:hypothetical protein